MSDVTEIAKEVPTVPADHLFPEELTTVEPITTEEGESITSALPPAQTSIIFGEPAAKTTQASSEKPTIPEAESFETTISPESEITASNEPTGTTEELGTVSIYFLCLFLGSQMKF